MVIFAQIAVQLGTQAVQGCLNIAENQPKVAIKRERSVGIGASKCMSSPLTG